MTAPCCSLAEKLPGRRLADLDAELRQPNHRSFRKLADAYGIPGQKSAVERHKKGCLRIGMGYEPPPVQDPPKGRAVRVEPVPEVSQGQPAEAGTATESVSCARAPEPGKGPKSLVDRTLYIVSQMAAGTWDSARDCSRCAEAWGLHVQTVRDEVRVILATRRLNRGDIEAKEEESLAFYAWQLSDLQATLADCVEPDERAKIHARMTEVRARMDAIAIPRAGTTINVNLAEDPKFQEAARRFVDHVQETLGAPDVIVRRLAARGVSVSVEAAAAVLDEAEAIIAAQFAPPPMLVESSPA